MSANGSLSSMSANGNLSTMSGNYSISTMAANGGMTCYKKACPNGGYLDEPNSTYFKSSQKGGTLGLTCYNATSCASGYSENGAGASYSYHSDITCKKCTYSCPSGYSFTTKSSDCSSSQTFKTTSATTQSGCTPNNECGKCETSYYSVSLKGESCCTGKNYKIGLEVPGYGASMTSSTNSSTFSVPAGENISIKPIYTPDDVGLGINYITEWRNGEMYKSHDGSSISNYTMPAADVKFTMMPDCSKACSGTGGSGSDYDYNFYVNGRIVSGSSGYNKTYTLEIACGDGTPSNYSGIKSVYVCFNTSGYSTQCAAQGCATVDCSTNTTVVWEYITGYGECPSAPNFMSSLIVNCKPGSSESGEDGDIITCNGKKLKLDVSP